MSCDHESSSPRYTNKVVAIDHNRTTIRTVHKIPLIYKSLVWRKLSKNEFFRNVKNPIETLTPVLRRIWQKFLKHKNFPIFSNFLHSNSYKLVVFCGRSLNYQYAFSGCWSIVRSRCWRRYLPRQFVSTTKHLLGTDSQTWNVLVSRGWSATFYCVVHRVSLRISLRVCWEISYFPLTSLSCRQACYISGSPQGLGHDGGHDFSLNCHFWGEISGGGGGGQAVN